MESARKDLDVIFKKINNSLKEFQSGAPEPDGEKITKLEVTFEIEDHEHQNKKSTRNLTQVSCTPEFSSLPSRRYKYVIKSIQNNIAPSYFQVLEMMEQRSTLQV